MSRAKQRARMDAAAQAAFEDAMWREATARLDQHIADVKAARPDLWAQMEADWHAMPAHAPRLHTIITDARAEMGEARWAELNGEWE